jgi:3'-phosphoadenosine 5'-phosphosulfate sulfotransferase (PAPS reductase)/FAD synthetase
VEERARRIGHNEALFREVNERIEKVSQDLQVASDPLAILCECGDQSCTDRVEVSLSDYERIRSDPTLFFIRTGHEIPDVETVVEQTNEFYVVRKRSGSPAELARELDSRHDS